MSILIKGMDMLKDGTYTSNIHVKGGKAILDNPIGLGYFELVEVVRCKDCMFNHWHKTPNGDKYHICNLNQLSFSEHADFYCAYGERREDAEIH